MEIKVEKLSHDQLKKLGVFNWPIWEKEVSRFPWFYYSLEECYILEGNVVIETEKGDKIEFGRGDFVTFPKGITCTWNIKQPVKKHYNFR